MASPTTWRPYASREEWADVSPVGANEPVDGPARISYTAEYEDALNYLRAVLLRNECSRRALDLTADVIRLNAAFYTAWQHRRACLTALEADIAPELALTLAMAERSSKNYQIWHHRRWALELLGASHARDELALTARLLQPDAKNYHVWSHRQWVLGTFGAAVGWGGEAPFVEGLLQEDVRNNSAWNHRWFVLTRRGRGAGSAAVAAPVPTAASGSGSSGDSSACASGDVGAHVPLPELESELLAALRHLARAYRNESAWSYARALLKAGAAGAAASVAGTGAGTAAAASAVAAAPPPASPLYPYAIGPGVPPCLLTPFAAAVQLAREAAEPGCNALANEAAADLLVGQALQGAAGAAAAAPSSPSSPAPAAALARAERLLRACCDADPIREAFWRWRADSVRALAAAGTAGADSSASAPPAP